MEELNIVDSMKELILLLKSAQVSTREMMNNYSFEAMQCEAADEDTSKIDREFRKLYDLHNKIDDAIFQANGIEEV